MSGLGFIKADPGKWLSFRIEVLPSGIARELRTPMSDQ
ncbi:hypothetical protein AB7M47_008400 [Bradyrhizobium elkanii]